MKKLYLLTQQFEECLQKYQHRCLLFLSKEVQALSAKKGTDKKLHSPNRLEKVPPSVMLALTVTSLTSIVGYRFYNHPQLAVGTISPTTIIAPRNDSFEDIKTTEEKRKAIRNGVIPILKRDDTITQQTIQEISQVLTQIEEYKELSGSFPFFNVKTLSLSSQEYLRKCQEWEWKTIVAAVEQQREVDSNWLGFWISQSNTGQLNPAIQQAALELQTYRKQVSQSQFRFLTTQISFVRREYARTWEKFLLEKIAKLNDKEKAALLDLSDETWQKIHKGIVEASQRILTQGIPPGMPRDLLEATVRIQLKPAVSEHNIPIITKLLVELLYEKPNLIPDKEETKTRAESAALEVEPVIVEIKQGEVIVYVGEKITQEDFVLLDGFGLSRRRPNWYGLGLSGAIVTGGAIAFWLVEKRVHRSMRCRDRIVLCSISASAPLLAIFGVPYTNLPAIGLLCSSFYGSALGVTQVVLLSGLVAFSTGGVSWEYLLAGAAGGVLAAAMASKLRSREELALLGGAVGLTQGIIYLIVNLILSATAGTIWYAVLPGAILYGLSGIAWSIVALGTSPYLERFFDLVTPIRLAELSNPNRPLLKRLAMETPGTFQHTMFVACLAEAAARELHCNVELVRAGTLYHDIGKMHDPMGFIENQMGGTNKHDEINDPWISAQIIKKHVSEGLVIARRYGLPKAVTDFIPEHQGKLLISYFYYQAKQKAEEEGTRVPQESEFRYDGPVPQSRETGIVMLADSCEAALRSLRETTPEAALVMMNKIFKARWQDNQLVDSGIKREEFPIIAEVFLRVWQQYNHKRIAYPKAALEPEKSSK